MTPFESSQNPANLPFSLDFVTIREELPHSHKELELLLLLRGSAHCRIYHMDYLLTPGELMIADVNDLHRIHGGSEDVLMLQLHLDTFRFEEIYPDISATFFVCEDPDGGAGKGALRSKQMLLRNQLARLAMDWFENPGDFVRQTDNINGILSTLMEQFRGFYIEDYQYRAGRERVSATDLSRMSRITRYILNHYENRISLEEVAASEHLNPYYVSHLVKKTLGLTFQQFLNAIRLEFAEKKLVFSGESLTRIAEDCGFSSLNYFNKCFYDWHGCMPAQYRKTLPKAEELAGRPFSRGEALELASAFMNPAATLRRLDYAPPAPEDLVLQPAFAPVILLSGQEDLIALGYLREQVLSLNPAGLLVNERLLAPSAPGFLWALGLPVLPSAAHSSPLSRQRPVRNTAQALDLLSSQGLHPERSPLPLFDDQGGLFTREGLASPLFTACRLLAGLSLNRESGNPRVLDGVRGASRILILMNPESDSILTLRLETKKLPDRFILAKTQIPEENNCYTLLENLGNPGRIPFEVIRRMDSAHQGVPQYSMVQRQEAPALDFIIYPHHVTILEITEAP